MIQARLAAFVVSAVVAADYCPANVTLLSMLRTVKGRVAIPVRRRIQGSSFRMKKIQTLGIGKSVLSAAVRHTGIKLRTSSLGERRSMVEVLDFSAVARATGTAYRR
jgi:hypothetical protein